jgi:hypothetical protein
MLAGSYLGQTYLGGLAETGMPSEVFQIVIDGTDYTSRLLYETFSLSSEIGSRTTLDLSLRDDDNSIVLSPGQFVIVYSQGSRLFAGTIDELAELFPASDMVSTIKLISLRCVNLNQICDRRIVAEAFATGQYPGQIVQSLLGTYLDGEGVTEGLIELGDFTLGRIAFDHDTLAKALDDLAKLVGFVWWIDPYFKLYFCDCGSVAAPFELTDSTPNFRRLEMVHSRELYRNRQYVRAGSDISAAKTENFKGDGERRTFTVELPLAEAPTLYINSVLVSSSDVGIREVDTGKEWYWAKGSEQVSQDASESVLSSGDDLQVDFTGLFPIRMVLDDTGGQTTRATVEGGSGIYEAVEDDERIDDITTAFQRADGFLRQFSRLPKRISFETDTVGLEAGQLLQVNLTRERVSGEFIVESVAISDLAAGTFRYNVEASADRPGERPSDFYKKLADRGKRFVLRETETLSIVRKALYSIVITDSLLVEQISNLGSWANDPYTIGLVGSARTGRSVTGYPSNV